jgi:hypothetical protein
MIALIASITAKHGIFAAPYRLEQRLGEERFSRLFRRSVEQ